MRGCENARIGYGRGRDDRADRCRNLLQPSQPLILAGGVGGEFGIRAQPNNRAGGFRKKESEEREMGEGRGRKQRIFSVTNQEATNRHKHMTRMAARAMTKWRRELKRDGNYKALQILNTLGGDGDDGRQG